MIQKDIGRIEDEVGAKFDAHQRNIENLLQELSSALHAMSTPSSEPFNFRHLQQWMRNVFHLKEKELFSSIELLQLLSQTVNEACKSIGGSSCFYAAMVSGSAYSELHCIGKECDFVSGSPPAPLFPHIFSLEGGKSGTPFDLTVEVRNLLDSSTKIEVENTVACPACGGKYENIQKVERSFLGDGQCLVFQFKRLIYDESLAEYRRVDRLVNVPETLDIEGITYTVQTMINNSIDHYWANDVSQFDDKGLRKLRNYNDSILSVTTRWGLRELKKSVAAVSYIRSSPMETMAPIRIDADMSASPTNEVSSSTIPVTTNHHVVSARDSDDTIDLDIVPLGQPEATSSSEGSSDNKRHTKRARTDSSSGGLKDAWKPSLTNIVRTSTAYFKLKLSLAFHVNTYFILHVNINC